jgi:hypothetical protein
MPVFAVVDADAPASVRELSPQSGRHGVFYYVVWVVSIVTLVVFSPAILLFFSPFAIMYIIVEGVKKILSVFHYRSKEIEVLTEKRLNGGCRYEQMSARYCVKYLEGVQGEARERATVLNPPQLPSSPPGRR